MSLWTPGGEHPTGPERPEGAGGQGPGNEPLDPEDLSPEDREKLQAMQEEMAQLREQLLGAPASVVIQLRHGPVRAGRTPPPRHAAQTHRKRTRVVDGKR